MSTSFIPLFLSLPLLARPPQCRDGGNLHPSCTSSALGEDRGCGLALLLLHLLTSRCPGQGGASSPQSKLLCPEPWGLGLPSTVHQRLHYFGKTIFSWGSQTIKLKKLPAVSSQSMHLRLWAQDVASLRTAICGDQALSLWSLVTLHLKKGTEPICRASARASSKCANKKLCFPRSVCSDSRGDCLGFISTDRCLSPLIFLAPPRQMLLILPFIC